MDPKVLNIGDQVAYSSVGPGFVTGFHKNGYPEVNGKAVGNLVRIDGAKYGSAGTLALPTDAQPAQTPVAAVSTMFGGAALAETKPSAPPTEPPPTPAPPAVVESVAKAPAEAPSEPASAPTEATATPDAPVTAEAPSEPASEAAPVTAEAPSEPASEPEAQPPADDAATPSDAPDAAETPNG